MKIINSTIEITSKDDGIRGKDYVAIKDANINVNSEGDGIKSTNDTDESLGYIKIEGGLVTINAGSDGIQAENILNISENANINITTTREITKTNSEDFQAMGRGLCGNAQNTSNPSTTTETDSKSSKRLKAGKEITIESGNIEIFSTDDGVHSNGIVVINNGTMNLSSGDDGIHADTSIAIHGGNINITKSYEVIESNYIEINGTSNRYIVEPISDAEKEFFTLSLKFFDAKPFPQCEASAVTLAL